MGKPGGSHVPSSMNEYIVHEKGTRGTETSKYPEEKKETSIPKVAASEIGRAQTGVRAHRGYGPQQVSRITNRTVWEVRPERVKVPYATRSGPRREAYQSSAELVELRVKQAGPPAKAKYSSMTDSERVGRLNDEKHGDEPS